MLSLLSSLKNARRNVANTFRALENCAPGITALLHAWVHRCSWSTWNIDIPNTVTFIFRSILAYFLVLTLYIFMFPVPVHLSTLYRTETHAPWDVNSTITCSDQATVSIHMLQSHEEYTNSATFFQFKDSKSPVSPVAPPELHPENSTTAGVYTIDLTQAMPDDSPATRSGDEPTGMIFRVQDIQSGNMTYIQLVHFSLTVLLM